MAGKIEIERVTRQNAENKQTFDLTGKIEIEGKNSSNLSENIQVDLYSKRHLYCFCRIFECSFLQVEHWGHLCDHLLRYVYNTKLTFSLQSMFAFQNVLGSRRLSKNSGKNSKSFNFFLIPKLKIF